MNYLTHQLLNTKEIELINTFLNQDNLPWEDGKKTAGNHAAKVKNNKQINKFINNLNSKFPFLILFLNQLLFVFRLLKS